MEATNRSSILNANITSGNMGDNIRNDIAWRDEWVARLRETEQYFDSFNRTASMPYTLFYLSDDIKQGTVDYNNRTVALSVETHLHGSGVWTVSIERALQAVYDGLAATKRKDTWGLASWPQRGVTNLNAFATRSQSFAVVFELLNSQNKVIGRQTLQTGGSWGVRSGRPAADVNADDRKTLTFQNVSADDITDRMTIRVATVNGTDAETAARNGVLQIRAITRNEFDRNGRYKFAKGTIQGFTNNAARDAEIVVIPKSGIDGYTGKAYTSRELELVIPGTIWGDPVVSIGKEAFKNTGANTYFGSVTIPNSVASIGEEAFYTTQTLTHVTAITIGANVAMTKSSFPDETFLSFYDQNGKKAGAYKVSGRGTWYNTSNLAFPPAFIGTWKREKPATTLTFTANTIKDSCNLQLDLTAISGDSYDMGRFRMTIKLVNGNLVIKGVRGLWDGTWIKQ
jgi:hypothetical protein